MCFPKKVVSSRMNDLQSPIKVIKQAGYKYTNTSASYDPEVQPANPEA